MNHFGIQTTYVMLVFDYFGSSITTLRTYVNILMYPMITAETTCTLELEPNYSYIIHKALPSLICWDLIS
jgi:hypothetical protein